MEKISQARLCPFLVQAKRAEFAENDFRYLSTVNGDVADFNGEEQILRAGSRVYALHYQGGLLR